MTKRSSRVPITTEWHVGDYAYYYVRKDLYLRVEIINITSKRVVVRPLRGGYHRATWPHFLHRSPPGGEIH